MPRPFTAEFRLRAVAFVRAGKPITTAAVQLGVNAAAIHDRVRQDQIDQGEYRVGEGEETHPANKKQTSRFPRSR